MPQNIPGNSASYPTNVEVPEDGDVRDAASVATGLEQLADRTAYIYAKGIIDGATKVKRVSSSAVLKAIASADVQDGDLRRVANSGIYVYFDTLSVAELAPFVYRPDDVDPQDPGRWIEIGTLWAQLGGTLQLVQDLTLSGSHKLTLGGAFQVGGTCRLIGAVSCDGNVSVGGNLGCQNLDCEATNCTTLTASGLVTCQAGLTVTGNVTATQVLATDAQFSGDCSVTGEVTCGTLHCTGAAVIDGQLTLNGQLLLNDLAVLGNGMNLTGTLAGSHTQTGQRLKTGQGRDVHRLATVASDANQTASFSTADFVLVPAGLLTAAREITVNNTGAQSGAIISLRTLEPGYDVTVKNAGGTTLGTLRKDDATAGKYDEMTLMFDGSVWFLWSYCG